MTYFLYISGLLRMQCLSERGEEIMNAYGESMRDLCPTTISRNLIGHLNMPAWINTSTRG